MSILLGDRNGPTTHKGDFQKSAHHPPNYEVTQMDNFKVYSSLNLGQIAPSVKNCLKSQIWGPPELAENLNPLHTMYTLTPSSIHTQKRTKTYILLLLCIKLWHALGSRMQVKKVLSIWKNRFGYPWLSIRKLHPPLNPAGPVSVTWTYPQQKLACFSPTA